MKLGDQRQSLSKVEDREFVAHLGEDAQEAVGNRLLSVGGNKRDRLPGTFVLLISFMQQFIDEATA